MLPKTVQNVPEGMSVNESNGILYVATQVDGKHVQRVFKTVAGAERYIAKIEAKRRA